MFVHTAHCRPLVSQSTCTCFQLPLILQNVLGIFITEWEYFHPCINCDAFKNSLELIWKIDINTLVYYFFLNLKQSIYCGKNISCSWNPWFYLIYGLESQDALQWVDREYYKLN